MKYNRDHFCFDKTEPLFLFKEFLRRDTREVYISAYSMPRNKVLLRGRESVEYRVSEEKTKVFTTFPSVLDPRYSIMEVVSSAYAGDHGLDHGGMRNSG